MPDQLSILYQIAQIDASVRDLEVELSKLPGDLVTIDANLNRLQTLLGAEKTRVEEAKLLIQKQEEEIRTRAESLSRAKSKAAKARNSKEADAVEREVETVRRSLKEREDDKLELQKLLDGLVESIGNHEKEFEELKKLSLEESEKIRSRMDELESEKKKIVFGREDLVQRADAVLFRRYDMIRTRKGGVGMAEAVDGTCMGCRLSIPSQQFVKVQHGDSIEQCPHCQRILYYRLRMDQSSP